MQQSNKINVFYLEDMNKTDSLYKNIHQDIIDRCKKGEQTAQFQLYKLYYKAMYNTCYRIVSDKMEAEDIMQEAFLKAFDKLDTYSGKVSFGAWLKRIVINHSLDQIKKKKLDFKNVEEYPHEIKEEKEEQENDISEQIEEIKSGVDQLADGYRIVLSLYLLEGYDHDEIGEILNISASTSRSQYTRAKNKLKEHLANNR